MWKTFDEALFFKLFKETFEAVRQYSCEDYIPREVMGMFKSISGFVGTRNEPVDYDHSAACELAEAMVTHCFCENKKDTQTAKGKWILFNSKIDVDFDSILNALRNSNMQHSELRSVHQFMYFLHLYHVLLSNPFILLIFNN